MAAVRSVPLRLAVLISGRGTNMLAIARACREGRIPAQIRIVVSDRADARGIELAREMGLPVVAIEAGSDRPSFEAALAQAVEAAGAELIVLAGFMRILSEQFVTRYEGRILNIHPSLLPDYKGLHTHRRVLAAAEREHGASVHFVTAALDGGPVVLQARIPVLAGDDEQSLSGRVQAREHIIYPRVIDWIARGRLAWRDQCPWLDGEPLSEPRVDP